jgi:hypothetical protein
VSAVPVKSWSGVLRDLARVTRPGGWIELVEWLAEMEAGGPATRRLLELTQQLSRSLGLDTTGVVVHALDAHLRRECLVQVERRDVQLPVGEWGGRVGSLLASDFRAGMTRLGATFESKFGVSAEEYRELLATAQAELEENHTTGTAVIAFGQKSQ